jgi:ADP-ribose pyrophosphatase YjhB (NUDIX family)
VFYANPVPACTGLIVHRGRVLLVRRAHAPYRGWWDLPGGFLEVGETPERGLVRELREEIGVGVRRARLLGFAVDRYGPGGVMVLSAFYRVTPTRLVTRVADDVSEARWFAIARLPWRTIAFPGLRRLLRRTVLRGEPSSGSPSRSETRGR